MLYLLVLTLENAAERAKREVMDMYKQGIKYSEIAMKIPNSHLPSQKMEEVERHRRSMEKNVSLAKGRLKDLGYVYFLNTLTSVNFPVLFSVLFFRFLGVLSLQLRLPGRSSDNFFFLRLACLFAQWRSKAC